MLFTFDPREYKEKQAEEESNALIEKYIGEIIEETYSMWRYWPFCWINGMIDEETENKKLAKQKRDIITLAHCLK